jgi:uncharacterized membrane protein YccC
MRAEAVNVNSKNWRQRVVGSAAVLLFAAFALRLAYDLISPILPLLCVSVCLAVAGWLYVDWRRRRRY